MDKEVVTNFLKKYGENYKFICNKTKLKMYKRINNDWIKQKNTDGIVKILLTEYKIYSVSRIKTIIKLIKVARQPSGTANDLFV